MRYLDNVCKTSSATAFVRNVLVHKRLRSCGYHLSSHSGGFLPRVLSPGPRAAAGSRWFGGVLGVARAQPQCLRALPWSTLFLPTQPGPAAPQTPFTLTTSSRKEEPAPPGESLLWADLVLPLVAHGVLRMRTRIFRLLLFRGPPCVPALSLLPVVSDFRKKIPSHNFATFTKHKPTLF